MFDESDTESFYFGGLSYEEASNLLETESVGTFLLRDSSSKQGFVLVVKEAAAVKQYVVHCKAVGDETHYYVREESSFADLPALLSFYKRNLFETTALVKPISKDKVKPHHGSRHKSAIFLPVTPKKPPRRNQRSSAPPNIDTKKIFVRVCKAKTPSPYDQSALRLSVGDRIEVTKTCDSGLWEGTINGKKGVFPAHCVEPIVILDEDGE